MKMTCIKRIPDPRCHVVLELGITPLVSCCSIYQSNGFFEYSLHNCFCLSSSRSMKKEQDNQCLWMLDPLA